MGAGAAVEAYKSLATAERAFRVIKFDLRVRPVHVYTEDHVRGHVFLCMLAYYVEWHLRQRLVQLLFEEDDREAARRGRATPVEEAEPSAGVRCGGEHCPPARRGRCRRQARNTRRNRQSPSVKGIGRIRGWS